MSTPGGFEFKYDHNTDGVHVELLGEHVGYLSSDDIGNFFKCLFKDRVDENNKSNQTVSQIMSYFTKQKICQTCEGKGVLQQEITSP